MAKWNFVSRHRARGNCSDELLENEKRVAIHLATLLIDINENEYSEKLINK